MGKRFRKTLYIVLAIWVLFYVAILLCDARFHFLPWWDIALYHELAGKLFSGGVPYVDFTFEYPPASILIFAIPRLLSRDIDVYRQIFQFFNFLAGAGLLSLSGLYAKKTGMNYRSVMIFQLAGLILISPILLTRFDVIVALVTFGGFYAYLKGVQEKSRLKYIGYFLIILAGFSKLYPFLIVPLLFLSEYKLHGYKMVLKSVLVALFLCLPFIIFLLIGNSGLAELLNYHSERGLEIESTYASALLILKKLGIMENVTVMYSHGSFGVSGPAASFLASESFIILILSYILLVVKALLLKWKDKPFQLLVKIVTLTVLLFIITSKVFSTQYYIWLFPWLILAIFIAYDSSKRFIIILLILISAFLASLIFPFLWWYLVGENSLVIGILLVRNLILGVLFFHLLSTLVSTEKI
ncbi:MAG: hypothetical protein ABIE03_04955 [Patescibacteria group bacterium]|nr:hypothetical protein [Patescibacteria group bacterium]